ncbi:MAG: hypothetical protein AAF557_14185 [Pseudomonadota bacterium]
MQISLNSKGFIAITIGVIAMLGLAFFSAFGAADEGPAETKGGFALSPTGLLIAYHFSQPSTDGKTVLHGIRIHTIEGSTSHLIEGAENMHLHSPTFTPDHQSLIVASACWAKACPEKLHGSRIISINLASGTWQVLTGDGLDEPFWDFGYVNETPESYQTQINRSHPVATEDGIYYLMSAASPRGVARAQDFAPRHLSPNDGFLIRDNGGHVGFRGAGSLAAFGPDALLVMAGAARGGTAEETARQTKTFAYLLDKQDGTILQSWGAADLEKLGITRPPSTESATGNPSSAIGYFAAGTDIIALAPSGPQVFLSANTDTLRIWDLALSGDGRVLLEVSQMPGSGIPALSYSLINTTSKDRRNFKLNFTTTPMNIIKIQ